MNEIEKDCKVLSKVAFLLAIGASMMMLSSCAVPLLTGLKSYKGSDGSTYEFITGADFNIGASGTDTRDDRRGINVDKYAKR